MIAEPFAETLEPRGERSLVVWLKLAIVLVAFVACVVGHAFDTRKQIREIAAVCRPEAARNILAGSGQVKKCRTPANRLKRRLDRAIFTGSRMVAE